jgi:hypothetical protein
MGKVFPYGGLGTCWEPKDIGHDFAKYTCKWNLLKNNIMQFKWVWKLLGRSFFIKFTCHTQNSGNIF